MITNEIKTYSIITYGCQMNLSDSERIASVLESINLKPSKSLKEADLVVLNTCSVRKSAEDRVFGRIEELRKSNKKNKIILTGCMSDRNDIREKLKEKVDIFLNIKDLNKLPRKLFVIRYSSFDNDYLKIPPKYTSQFRAYVPIMTGCNNFCTYCVVPYARGREISRPEKEIIDEIKNLIKKGYKEITLLGQNVNSYKPDFSKLLRKINTIPGNFRIFFLTSHPKDMSNNLIEAMAECEKICHYLHLPVQSGNNEILRKMNRNYTREHYINLIKKVRKAIPDITISTDTIVGFPGETKKQFEQTVDLYKKIKFDMAYIAQYSERPGTAAAKFEDNVPRKEKKRRKEVLNEILKETALENNKKLIGKSLEVLIDRINKKKETQKSQRNSVSSANSLISVSRRRHPIIYYGKTRGLKNVAIKTDQKKLIGKFINVKINKVTPWNLEGEMD